MAGAKREIRDSETLSDYELRVYQAQLSSLAETASSYPMEYALGSYELLFESREDIEIIVDNLSESISRSV
jgi:hypothetical protein